MKTVHMLLLVLILPLLTPLLYAQQLTISGSTTAFPLLNKASKAFMKKYSNLKVTVSSIGSSKGIEQLINGETDMAVSSRYLVDEEINLAASKGIHLVPFQIAYDYVIPIVHPRNTIKNISAEHLRDIYSGTITNWKFIGGPDQKIDVISRDKSSGTYSLWESKILVDQHLYGKTRYVDSNFAMVKEVSRNPQAIGYISHGFLNLHVKPLSVDGIYGSRKNAIYGKYPLNRTIFIFTRGWPQSKNLKFINFLQNPKQGRKLVEESGLVSIH